MQSRSTESVAPAVFTALLGLAFAVAHGALALAPLLRAFVHVPEAFQAVSRPLRFALALLCLGFFWAGLLRVHGASARAPLARKRDAWILWGGLSIAVALLALPALVSLLVS
jgi:hypothetical protein